MSDLMLQAELQKLAAALDTSVAELSFLSHLDIEALRSLREASSAAIFDRHVKGFRKLAESTKLLPNKLVAVIAEKVIPPFLSAQITCLLEPDDAVDLSRRLEVSYLADVTTGMDPRRAVPVLQAMPTKTVVAVAMELLNRREFMVMARFVDDLTDEQILAVSREMNGEGLLRVGFFVENDERLDQLLGMLSEDQIGQTMPVAASNDGLLWPEILSMISRLGPQQRQRLAQLWDSAKPEVLQSFSAALLERGLWQDALPLLNSLDQAAQEVIATSLASHAKGEVPKALLAAVPDALRAKISMALGD